MLWLVDECLPHSLVLELRKNGHDVLYAAESARETDDVDLADLALREGRLILTEDKDFGGIVFLNGQTVPGIVLLRIAHEHRRKMWPKLLEVIEHFGDALYGNYVVVSEARFRSRALGTR